MAELRLRAFGNRVLIKISGPYGDEVTGGVELYGLYCSQNFF